MHACIMNIYVPHEVKNQRALAKTNYETWTRCSNPKGTDVKYPNWGHTHGLILLKGTSKIHIITDDQHHHNNNNSNITRLAPDP